MRIGNERKEGVLEKSEAGELERKTAYSDRPIPKDLHATETVEREDQYRVGESPETPSRLFSTEQTESFRSRWDTIQTGFVDEPRRAVKQADGLVTEVINHVAQTFADERSKLEGQFSENENAQPSTEDLRLALRRYRAFFGRLLAV